MASSAFFAVLTALFLILWLVARHQNRELRAAAQVAAREKAEAQNPQVLELLQLIFDGQFHQAKSLWHILNKPSLRKLQSYPSYAGLEEYITRKDGNWTMFVQQVAAFGEMLLAEGDVSHMRPAYPRLLFWRPQILDHVAVRNSLG